MKIIGNAESNKKKLILTSLAAIITVIAIIILAVILGGNDKKVTAKPTFIETSIETTVVENIETDSTTEVVETTEETNITIVEGDITTGEPILITNVSTEYPHEVTVQTTTKPPAPTTTCKKQDPTINMTTKAPVETGTDPAGEIETYWEIQTQPSNEIETYPDPGNFEYTDELLSVDPNVKLPDWWQFQDITTKQISDKIRCEVAQAKYTINYNLENNNEYNVYILEHIIKYLESHDPNTMYMIVVDAQTPDDWRRICATWLQSSMFCDAQESLFDWKLVTQSKRCLNNFLWDTIYNDDFSNITDIKVIEIYDENDELYNFEYYENGVVEYNCLYKISFKSGGANYHAWFGNGDTLLDIDRLN